MSLKYIFHKLDGFPNPRIKDFFCDTLKQGEGIINGAEMREAILGHRYPVKGLFGGVKMVEGFFGLESSRQAFYDRLMTGDEVARKEGQDQEIDLLVRVKRMGPGVLGSMTPGNPWYNLSLAFLEKCFSRRRPHDLFGNSWHEYVHHMGFYHETKNKAERAYDPAYACGRIGRGLFGGAVMLVEDSKWMNSACMAG